MITLDEAASKFVAEYAAATQDFTGVDDVEAVRERGSILIIAGLPDDQYVATVFDDAEMDTETAQEIFQNLARLVRSEGSNPEALAKWRRALAIPSAAMH